MSNRRTNSKEKVPIGHSTKKIKLKQASQEVKESFVRCELTGRIGKLIVEKRSIKCSKNNKIRLPKNLQICLGIITVILAIYLLIDGQINIIEMLFTIIKLYLEI